MDRCVSLRFGPCSFGTSLLFFFHESFNSNTCPLPQRREKLKIRSLRQIVFLIIGLICGQLEIAWSASSLSSLSTDAEADTEDGSDSPDSRSVIIPTDVNDPSASLRRGIAITVGEAPQTPARAARNLLMSFVLLITIVVAGTITIRDIQQSQARPNRSCPLDPCFKRGQNGTKGKEESLEDCLSDSPVDWDTIMLSTKYSCVFDPSRLSIDNLLALPPPSFKSKVDFVSAVNYLTRLSSGNRQYISISE